MLKRSAEVVVEIVRVKYRYRRETTALFIRLAVGTTLLLHFRWGAGGSYNSR